MKKKIYNTPLIEVAQINLSQCLLDGSPVVDPRPTDLPLGPGPSLAPKHRVDVF